MAQRKKPVDQMAGQITNAEKEQRRQHEEKLSKIPPIQQSPPHWLSKIGKHEWNRIHPHLHHLSVSVLDSTVLAMYCDAYSQYRTAKKDIEENGQTIIELNSQGNPVKKKNPSMDIYMSTAKEIRAIAGSMGLTLDSRLRLIGLGEDDEEEDPFEKMMNNAD